MTTQTTYYSAGAGSGKTHTLTTLLNEHIKNGVNPSEIILTTFTDLAASEFRTKAREALIKDGNMKAASELDSAAIGTVHSVAYSFVRKYWDYLNISPNSTIISENNKKSILYQLLNEIIKKEDFDTIIRYNEFFGLENNNYAETINSIIGNCYYHKITDLKESKDKSSEYINGIFNGGDIKTDKIIKFVQDYLTAPTGDKDIKKAFEKLKCFLFFY
jgi:superfamily I DNA/RNA helicase